MLQAREVSLDTGARVLIEAASFTVRKGDKVGLVGRNGAGKTTLLRALAGITGTRSGTVTVRGTLGYVPQDPRIDGVRDGVTALSRILSGRGLDAAAERLEELRRSLEVDHSHGNVQRYSSAEDSYRLAGGYSAESEARRLAAGLGIPDARLDLPLRALSGGERRRVELARVLFAHSDVLLLDEPTNHLDLDAKAWLMSFLRGYRGALLVVSHDLELLDSAITRVLHLDHAQLVEYKGTFTQYKAARARDEERLGRERERQQAEIHRLASLADSMRHQTAKRARTAKSLDKRVERLRSSVVNAPRKERQHAFRFPPPPHSGRVSLEASALTKGYGGPPVFADVSFTLERGERLLVLGLNGAGKTSLLRILAGISTPDSGGFKTGHGVSLGYYAQEHEGIEPGRSVLEHMRFDVSTPEPLLRTILGMFGLHGEQAFQDAGTLSGGEKTKLALAQLVTGRHNLLLLDEPTNNLDPPSRDAIGRALSAWPGSMVIVSHDTDFVNALHPDRVLSMPEGTLDYWDDNLLELVALA